MLYSRGTEVQYMYTEIQYMCYAYVTRMFTLSYEHIQSKYTRIILCVTPFCGQDTHWLVLQHTQQWQERER